MFNKEKSHNLTVAKYVWMMSIQQGYCSVLTILKIQFDMDVVSVVLPSLA